MYQNLLILATVIAVIIFIFGAGLFGAWAAKRKINVQGIIDDVKANIPIITQIETMLVGLLPEPYKAMASTITEIIKKAVEVAEDLYLAGSLTDAQRKAKAIELINTSLALEKVTITEKVSTAISLTVDLAAILFLPKSHTPIPAAQ